MMKEVRRELFNEINITPLTDIFLVLLIIMMVVAPLLDYRGLDLTLTTTEGTPAKAGEESKQVWVAIAADGQYTVDGSAVDFGDLAATIRKQAEAKPEGAVIEADPDSNHAALAHAIDSAQAAGIKSVSVVESTPPPPPPPPAEKKAKKKK
jgi:biopolymer transport protein ExbD/biopolymer transport protein TolR